MKESMIEQAKCYNQLVIDSSKYDAESIKTTLGSIIFTLMDNGYNAIVTSENDRFYIIEYNVASIEVGDPQPVWYPQD